MPRPRPLPSVLEGRAFCVSEAYFEGVPHQRMSRSDLQSPFHGVRLDAAVDMDLRTRCRAYITKAHLKAVFSHITAAQLWGIPLPRTLERDERVHVLLSGGSRAPRGVGVVGHVTATRAIAHEVDGLPVSSPVDTWIALAGILDVDDLIVAGDRLLDWREPLCTLEELASGVTARTRVRGLARARSAFVEIRERSHSPRETRCRLALTRAGLPEPELNAEIVLSDGTRVHGDLVYRHQRVLLEYEDDGHRTDETQWNRDLDRYNRLSESGWTVVRVSKRMPEAELIRTVRRLLQRH